MRIHHLNLLLWSWWYQEKLLLRKGSGEKCMPTQLLPSAKKPRNLSCEGAHFFTATTRYVLDYLDSRFPFKLDRGRIIEIGALPPVHRFIPSGGWSQNERIGRKCCIILVIKTHANMHVVQCIDFVWHGGCSLGPIPWLHLIDLLFTRLHVPLKVHTLLLIAAHKLAIVCCFSGGARRSQLAKHYQLYYGIKQHKHMTSNP